MTPEYLNECFVWDYDGNLTWKERPRSHFTSDGGYKTFNTKWANKPAGSVSKSGYGQLTVNSITIGTHRILYMLYHNTTIPDGLQVDHEDENKLNNTFKNLRLGTGRQNCYNISITKNNTSGYKGVSLNKPNNNFRSYITIGTKLKHLGMFNTAEEAHEAYKVASMKYHGEFSNFG